MIKIFSKKHVLTFISSFAVGTGVIIACAGDWGDESDSSNWTPQTFVDSAYRPFFYSSWNWFYEGYDNNHNARFDESNLNDWSGYLGSNVPAGHIESLLNTRAGVIDSTDSYLTGKGVLHKDVQAFTWIKKGDKKVAAFFNYLAYAKDCEEFATRKSDFDWDYDPKKPKDLTVNTKDLNEALLKEFNQSKDAFVKERFWFQLVRSYFFNDAPQKAIDFFESNEKAFPKNDLYYRSLSYTAGAYYKLKNYSKANYYYSKAYDGCNALKTATQWSFHPQEESDWNATLALCANNEEKITLWQLLGTAYQDEKRSIKEIYALNPASDKLNLLLTRAINKEEARFTGYEPYAGSYGFVAKKDTLNSELYALTNRIAQANNTNQPWMWYMAAGYLNTLNGSFDKAAACYKLAEKKLPKDDLAQAQLRLLKTVNTIVSTPVADSKFEKKVLPDLQWLMKGSLPADVRKNAAITWIRTTLSNKYKKQKEYVKAVCFTNYTAFYLDNKNVEELKSFITKPNKAAYESLYAQLYKLTIYDLYEYQAVNAALNDNLGEAIAKMDSVANPATLPGNPFNGRLQDCHDCDHAATQKIKYTKLSFLKKLKEMEDKVTAGSDVYTNAMLAANAFYNITHYGNARAFYENNIVGSYHYSPFAIDSAYRAPLTDMKLAAKYYTVALKAAKTDEQRAKCHFMLAKCERNKYYNETFYNNKENEYGKGAGSSTWNGFVALKKQYANTKFYQEALKECGDFRGYAGMQ